MIKLMPLLLLVSFAAAAETEVPPAARTAVELTIYEQDLALVKDRRSLTLPADSAELAFTGVSSQMQAETALLRVLTGEALSVAEQTFDFDVISPDKLLRRSVGGEVTVVSTNPATGRDTVERARVISVDNGLVLEIAGKIHTEAPGRIVFDALPDDLRTSPTLVVAATGKAGAQSQVELSYLTGGLSWRADYVADYDADARRLDLTAWATVMNTAGVDFDGAKLKLVSGQVNRASAPREPKVMMRAMEMAAAAPMADGVAAEAVGSFHLYDFAPAVDLAANQTKQLALMEASGIAVTQEYVVRGQPNFYFGQMQGAPQPANAETVIAFANDAAAKLGLPLPAGVARVYGADAAGADQFLGEDRIGHIPEGGEVRITLGRDFDITAERQQMSFVRAAENLALSVWRIALRNAKDKAVTVRVVEPLQGDWEILKETAAHTKTNANTAEWLISVPAKGEAVLEYNVRSRF
ncbi:MAG: DUF4139 domain-containing protein [Rhodospirillaceae bacterium]|nr:DUF4139 domain-containing protein [Rhodospirillaceae bacterium]